MTSLAVPAVPDILRDQLQRSLGAAYAVGRELGGGGMSRVFVAHEAALGRDVVVKVLAPDLAEGLSADRFAREIRLAAGLQQAHIVPVLAAGVTAEGLPYFTMPFVDGESLRQRMAKGPLTIAESVGILRDVAQALAFAHGRGIVHRDIKPENILLSGGSAVVADFGIAKALHAARTAAANDGASLAATLTQVGTSLGTPAYMSPEQAAGDPDVDARADLYSWGLVAYELLAGAPPFVADSAHRLVLAHIGEAPPPLAPRAPDAPPLLADLVMRCLEKDPARRPQSASELLTALEAARPSSARRSAESLATVAPGAGQRRRARIAAAAVVVLGVGMLAWMATSLLSRSPEPAAPPVLAVLPFENVGPPGDAYFADGLTDEVRGRLAGITGLRVIGGTSARQYKGSTKSPRQIASELGATYLLTGTVRWDRGPDSQGRVRVSPELVRATDQASVWAEPVEGPLSDVFAMQARVAERVAAALDVTLLAREQRTVAARPTKNLAAYDAYLRGLASSTQAGIYTVQGFRPAIAEFERAVALDPTFAVAHALLARVYSQGAAESDPTMLAKAQASVERAWALDSTLIDTRLARAAYLMAAGQLASAEQSLRNVAETAPDNVDVLVLLAKLNGMLGRPDRSIASLRRAAVLDPLSGTALGLLSGALDRTYQFEEAISIREREIALTPQNHVAYAAQAWDYLLWRADTAAARRMLARGGPALEYGWLVWLPSLQMLTPVLSESLLSAQTRHARDTITRQAFEPSTQGIMGPAAFDFMKMRHFATSGRQAESRAYAESLVVHVTPALRDRADYWVLFTSMRATLAEAYAYLGRPVDAAREANRAVAEARRATVAYNLATALASAAHVEVLIGQHDDAIVHLTEVLSLPAGFNLSPAVLRAEPVWAPLRGIPAFERLIAGR